VALPTLYNKPATLALAAGLQPAGALPAYYLQLISSISDLFPYLFRGLVFPDLDSNWLDAIS
jgi:hypothetical protein